MKSLPGVITLIFVSLILCTSCESFDKVSDIPEIHFKSLTPYQTYWITTTDTTIIDASELVFSFQDGNADFGVDRASNPEDTINFFMIPFQKTDGVYEPIDADLYGRKYTITRQEQMDRTGQNKTIRGEIKLEVYYFLPPPFDTIRYDFYIVDRAGNQSNVESTSDLIF